MHIRKDRLALVVLLGVIAISSSCNKTEPEQRATTPAPVKATSVKKEKPKEPSTIEKMIAGAEKLHKYDLADFYRRNTAETLEMVHQTCDELSSGTTIQQLVLAVAASADSEKVAKDMGTTIGLGVASACPEQQEKL